MVSNLGIVEAGGRPARPDALTEVSRSLAIYEAAAEEATVSSRRRIVNLGNAWP